jgi:hypothetical protein
LQAYRKETGQTLPRILLLVDEFHKFFIEDDKLATRAYQLLELLVREGRSAGIHILLASQTLTGAAHLPDTIKEQIGIRIALQCSEADSRLILSDDNAAARLLSRPGEAIYNAANGLVEGNNSCQVAWMTDAQREQYLTALQRRAQADAYHTSQIVFEGNQPADIEKNHSLEAALVAPAPAVYPRDLKAWLGEPVAIEDSVAALFQRQSSSNLLIVGQDNDLALGMLVIALISLAAQLPVDQTSKACTFSILDFSVSDSEQARLITQLAEHIPHSVAVGRQRQLQGMMTGLEKEVQRRIEGELYSEPHYSSAFTGYSEHAICDRTTIWIAPLLVLMMNHHHPIRPSSSQPFCEMDLK